MEKEELEFLGIKGYELSSLWWIAWQTGLDFRELCFALAFASGEFESIIIDRPYQEVTKSNNGKERKLLIPHPLLMKVQKKINDHILSQFIEHPCVCGFSGGGGPKAAIKPHLEAEKPRILFCLDIKDAFDNTEKSEVLWGLTTRYLKKKRIDSDEKRDEYREKEKYIQQEVWVKESFQGELTDEEIVKIKRTVGRWRKYEKYQIFQLPELVPNIIARLCTYKYFLPQGAPTSPRSFDLALWRIDRRMAQLAKNVRGIYTRYADNIGFSMATEVPLKVKRAITRILVYPVHLSGRNRYADPCYELHKIREIEIPTKFARRIFGVNIIGDKLYNTRDYKRKLRLLIFHIERLREYGKDDTEAIQSLRGQIAWAEKDTLPPELLMKCQEILNTKKIN